METKLAYMAGLIDGEGHIAILYDRAHNRFNGVMGIVNTDIKMIDWLQDNFGGSTYHWSGKSKKPHWREKYEWRTYSHRMERIIRSILPFLITKREQAETMLNFRNTFIDKKRLCKKDTFPIRHELYLKIKSLNQHNIPL